MTGPNIDHDAIRDGQRDHDALPNFFEWHSNSIRF